MIHPITLLLLLLSPPQQPMAVTQLTIRQRIVVRVPNLPPPPRRPAAPPIAWREGKGPKCVALASMAGAAVDGPDRIDLVLTGGARLRAKLDGDCPPLDYYSGFYIRPSADGKVCAGRDPIRVRSGASCPIKQFKALSPKR